MINSYIYKFDGKFFKKLVLAQSSSEEVDKKKNTENMEVLKRTKFAFKLIGIIDSKENNPHLKLLLTISQYICLIAPILLLTPMIAFFFANFDNVAESTSAFYLICIILMGYLTYIDTLHKKSTVLSIIEHIQYCVNQSEIGFKSCYVECESIANKSVEYYNIFVLTSVFGAISIPISILIFQWITGIIITEQKILPASLQ